jgi:hypothetical protein
VRLYDVALDTVSEFVHEPKIEEGIGLSKLGGLLKALCCCCYWSILSGYKKGPPYDDSSHLGPYNPPKILLAVSPRPRDECNDREGVVNIP